MWATYNTYFTDTFSSVNTLLPARRLLRNVRDCYLQKHAAVCRTRFSNWTHTCTHGCGDTRIRLQIQCAAGRGYGCRHRYRYGYSYRYSCRYMQCQCLALMQSCIQSLRRHLVEESADRRTSTDCPKSFQVNNKWSIIIRHQTRRANIEYPFGLFVFVLVLVPCVWLPPSLLVCIAIDLFFGMGFFNFLQPKPLHDM